MPEVVVRGDSLAFFPLDAPGGHFELSSAHLSYLAQTSLLVNGLGPVHPYLLRFGPGSK